MNEDVPVPGKLVRDAPHHAVRLETIREIELPRDRDILVHCKLGGRSARACEDLAAAGFTRLYNLEGGIIAWATDVDSSLNTY